MLKNQQQQCFSQLPIQEIVKPPKKHQDKKHNINSRCKKTTIAIILLCITCLILLSINVTFPFNKSAQKLKKENSLAIQTVFILRQNIPFLRQWIEYHSNLGIDNFYLYDNTGSQGYQSPNKTTNRQGITFAKVIPYSQQQIQNEIKSIKEKFKDRVLIKKWQPKDQKGRIIYGQSLAIHDYWQNFAHLHRYTLFTDIDQFLFSPKQISLENYIQNKDLDGFSKLIFYQKKFADRFCYQKKKVTQIYSCIQILNETKNKQWAPKMLVKNELMIQQTPIDIDHIKTNGKVYQVPMDQFRLNHYNLNKQNFIWLNGFQPNQYKLCNDKSMKRYKEYIDLACADKCHTNNLKLVYGGPQTKKQNNCKTFLIDYTNN